MKKIAYLKICGHFSCYVLACIFLFWITPLFAKDKFLEIGQFTQTPVSLTPYFSVLEDSDRTLTFEQIQTMAISSRFKNGVVASDNLNFGYSTSAYWLCLNIINTSHHVAEKMLEIDYPFLAYVDFYLSDKYSYQHFQTGYAMTFEQRPFKNRSFILPISLSAHSTQQIYLRIQTPNALLIPAKLWDMEAFYHHEYIDNSVQFLYFGVAFAMVLYNLFLFGTLRDVSYLWYVLFSIFSVLAILFYTGQADAVFSWTNPFLATNIGVTLTTSWMFVFFLLFMRQMLNTRIVMPRLDSLIKIFIGINALLPAILPMVYGTVIIVATTSLVLVISLICVCKRQRSAYLFMISFTCFFVIITAKGLSVFSFLSIETYNPTWQLQFGSAWEMLSFSITLANRYNLLRNEKESVQQQLVITLQTTEKMLQTKVTERTKELEIASEQLQILFEKEHAYAIEKSNFLAMLTHELKSPLATIQIASSNLKNSKNSHVFDLCVRHIEEASTDMTGIIERCIQADQLEKANSSINFSSFSVCEVVEELVLRFNASSRVQIHINPEFSIVSDLLLCRTILSNLLDNALKYSPKNSQVTVSVWQNVEKTAAIISVCNQIGEAGKPDECEVFVKYYRNTQAQRLRGTGLGLWLVKGITKQLDGDVRYISHDDKIEFECYLPSANCKK